MQNYTVQPLKAYILKYTGLYTIIIRDLSRGGGSRDERERQFVERLKKLKSEFAAERKAEYLSKTYKQSAYHTCTKGSSGGTKVCRHNKIHTPDNLMRTSNELSTKRGSGRVKVKDDGKTVYLRQQLSGKGKKRGYLDAVFKFREDLIKLVIEDEVIDLFSQIAENFDKDALDFDEQAEEASDNEFIESDDEIDYADLAVYQA